MHKRPDGQAEQRESGIPDPEKCQTYKGQAYDDYADVNHKFIISSQQKYRAENGEQADIDDEQDNMCGSDSVIHLA
jgi:hypothetical protein